jgi:hypothetical protein
LALSEQAMYVYTQAFSVTVKNRWKRKNCGLFACAAVIVC